MRMAAALGLALVAATSSYCQKESLLIGPGDLVAVTVFQTPELSQRTRVNDAGELSLVLGGNVKLAGLTPEQGERVVEHALIEGLFLRAPSVTLTVEEYATQSVSVLGQVKTPGAYPIGTPRSVIDVLALAGGLTEMADRKITIERRATKERLNYYMSNSPDKALQAEIEVYPGDKIIVARTEVVYILGDVAKPGGFPESINNSRLTVLEAVALAGGTPPNAVPSHTRLIRKHPDGTYEELHIPLSDMQKGKRPDMPLEADDILYVPFSYARNMAVGIGGLVAAAAGASIYHF